MTEVKRTVGNAIILGAILAFALGCNQKSNDKIYHKLGTNIGFNSKEDTPPSNDSYYTCLRNFYVSVTGNDLNNGTSESSAKRTIQGALSNPSAGLTGGDCINVLPGTYNEAIGFFGVQGNADTQTGYLVLRSTQRYGAKIKAPPGTYSAVNMAGNYTILDGFDIDSDDNGGHGVQTDGYHHHKILNNLVHDCGGSGISGAKGDYFYVEGNIVRNNSATNWFHTSGISYWEPVRFDDKPGFHIVVRNNISHSNLEIVPTDPTDGNGIIMDHLNTMWTAEAPPPDHPVLIENNLVYDNGGKGIHLLYSDFVTVINNISYHNNKDNRNKGTWRGELSNNNSKNNLWIDNVAVADPAINSNNTAIGSTYCCGATNENVRWISNLTFNGTRGAPSVAVDAPTVITAANGNLLGVDPKFVLPSVNRFANNFTLQSTSPALDLPFENLAWDWSNVATQGYPAATRPSPSPSAAPAPAPAAAPAPAPAAAPSPTPAPCPQNILGNRVPANPVKTTDLNAVELGAKFRSTVDGQITGIRFYRGANSSTGFNVYLYDSSGKLLRSSTASGSVPGYISANFGTPVSVLANTTYTASYHAPNGQYAYETNGLSSAITKGVLSLLGSGSSGGNGVYRYGSSGGAVPTSSYSDSDYFVDVIFVAASSIADTVAPSVHLACKQHLGCEEGSNCPL